MADIKIINGEFEKRTPESQGVSSRDIVECIEAIKSSGEDVHALWVFKNGYLVAGGCANPFNELTPRRVYSTMKSVIALAILFCVQEGKLNFEDRIIDYFKEEAPDNPSDGMKNLTLRQTLNMSVGQFDDALGIFHAFKYGIEMVPFTMREAFKTLPFNPEGMSIEEIFFSIPIKYKPGTRFHYVNTVPELLIRLITKVTGEDFIHYLKSRLFEPLGIDIFNCQETMKAGWSPNSKPRRMYDDIETYLDGSTTVTTTKDLCKFALFFLQKGSWEGKQLLDAKLIEEATSKLIPTDQEEDLPEFRKYGYGMQIWRNSYGGFCMVGGSGQEAVIIPEENYVVVYNSMNTHLAELGTKMPEIVRDCIYKRMFKNAIAEDPEGVELMEKAFNEWSTMPVGCAIKNDNCKQYERTYELDGVVDGIKSIKFNFEEQLVDIEQDNNKCTLKYGIDGNFEKNNRRPIMPAEGYSHVYGADPTIVYASGGWKSEKEFVLQLQYADDLKLFRYTCEFDDNGAMSIKRWS